MPVLIVEDDALLALAVADDLIDHGIESEHAHNCDEALTTLCTMHHQFEAAVLDVDLGNGETSEPVATMLSKAAIPFLFYSGNTRSMEKLAIKYDAPTMSKLAGQCVLSRKVRSLIGED